MTSGFFWEYMDWTCKKFVSKLVRDCSPFKKSTLAQLTKADGFKSSLSEIAGDF